MMMMKYNLKRRWGAVLLVFLTVLLLAGYAVGDYFVDYALKRGSDTDPLAPPAACNAPKVKFIVEGAGHGDAMKEAGKGYWQAVFDFLSLHQKG